MFWKPLSILLPVTVFGTVTWFALTRNQAVSDKPLVDNTASVVPAETPSLVPKIPVLEGTPLKFEELYVLPAGPKGLEYSTKANELNGKKVRMDGYMVKHYNDDPTIFMFAAVPTAHNQVEYALADSLPISLVHVILEGRPGDAPAWIPRRITLTGRLELGSRQEMDGRVSNVRLFCDQVVDSKTMAALELRRPLAFQRDRMAMGAIPNFRLPQTSTAKAPTDTPQ